MDSDDLKLRTKQLSLRILNLVDHLPRSTKGRVIADQLARAGTSVGANYRAACRARSKAEFVSKLGIVIEEADECSFWIELILDGGILDRDLVQSLWDETDQLISIMTASRKTAQHSLQKGKRTI